MSRPLPEAELLEAVHLVRNWSPLRGARIFLTGGTGFFGKWLLEVLGAANQVLKLEVEAVVLSRNPTAFLETMPHLRHQLWLRFHPGDITTFDTPSGSFSHLIHGATSSDARDYAKDPQAMQQTMVDGTRRIMEILPVRDSFRALFLSSGAVYGPQPLDLTHFPEDHPLPSGNTEAAPSYAQGKREAERLFTEACLARNLAGPIARCFAFAGPHLPMNQHFAFGNFVRDALQAGPIRVQGDGSPLRSYLYASELAAWLWTLLIHGASTTYHVGSDQDLSIRDLATTIGKIAGVATEIRADPTPGQPPSRYVPAVTRIPEAFGLHQSVGLEQAIVRTLQWHRG
jgi:dTDP-glucose 4,6-dehydratase